jgi:hypothetical protein
MTENVNGGAAENWLPLVLPALFAEDSVSGGLGVYGEKNLFRRIIRNPAPGGRPPKERECAEMLCGCLMNLPFFQTQFLEWMADRAGQKVDVGALDFRFRTEQPVWTKRDDLRIEGVDENGVRKLLWTVEIKVKAGFHWSSAVDSSTAETVDGSDSEGETLQDFVNQLENYDKWLKEQKADFKAGFVISIWDQTENLPEGLECSWTCLTWRDVAGVLRGILEEGEVPDLEVLWCKHSLGFIEQALGGRKMSNILRMEDIALFKVYQEQGNSTFESFGNLLKSVKDKIHPSSPLPHTPTVDNKLFATGNRCLCFWSFSGIKNTDYPVLSFGIVSEGGFDIVVYISNEPKHAKKNEIRDFIEKKFEALNSRKSFKEQKIQWNFLHSATGNNYWDIELRIPVETLFGQADQAQWMADHVLRAFEDLKETGIIKGIQDILAGKTPSTP